MDRITLADKLALFSETWTPKVIGQVNDCHVKLARLEGAYVWHAHADEDELFLVLEGHLEMHYRDRVVELRPGDLCIVPRGVEHKPVAPERCAVLLVEPASTVNIGDGAGRTRFEPGDLEWI